MAKLNQRNINRLDKARAEIKKVMNDIPNVKDKVKYFKIMKQIHELKMEA